MSTTNLIGRALLQKNVNLPDAPTNYLNAFRDAGVASCYIITMSGRSGSTWLASALKQIPGAGHPVEYFSEEGIAYYGDFSSEQSLGSHLKYVASKYASNGRFGFKINPDRLKWLSEYVDISLTFPQGFCSWIDMRRWNIVKQAFSFARAKKTGKWHSFSNEESTQAASDGSNVEVSDSDVWKEILSILRQERNIKEFYRDRNISPLVIFYEEIFDSKRQLLLKVLHQIKAPVHDIKLLDHVLDGTRKFTHDEALERAEDYFQFTYADLVSHIFTLRETMDLNVFRARVQQRLRPALPTSSSAP